MRRDEMNRMREAVAQSTGERYCAYCAKYKPLQGGRFKSMRSQKRWQCKDCVELRKGKK